ncbi:MAG: STAS domain-containing protein [Actinomycetota bacterium]
MTPLEVVATDDPRRYCLVGELDMYSVDELSEGLQPQVAAGGDLRLDLSELTFIDSSGIRALFQLNVQLEDGTLILERPSPFAQRVMGVLGVGESLDGPRIGD